MKSYKLQMEDFKLMSMLIVGTLCCLGLAMYLRMKTNTTMYNFLAWDIFLAWIPLMISTLIGYVANRNRTRLSWVLILLLCAAWLFLLPNAAYLLTELLHAFRYFDLQGEREFWFQINFWYSLTLTFTVAVLGLLLSTYTLYQMQRVLNSFLQPFGSRLVVGIMLLLSSLGVYIGRFNRWNSWDVLYQPHLILMDLMTDLTQAGSILVEFVALIFIIQAFGYVIFSILASRSNP